MILTAKIQKFLIIFTLLIFLGCGRDDDASGCLPQYTVNVAINTNLAAYQNLNFTGGWIYYNDDLAGSRGLIVVNTGNGFKAYDRNAPHICPSNQSTLIVENDVLIVCPQDDAQWILTTGQPTAVTSVPPKQYFANYINGVVYISN